MLRLENAADEGKGRLSPSRSKNLKQATHEETTAAVMQQVGWREKKNIPVCVTFRVLCDRHRLVHQLHSPRDED